MSKKLPDELIDERAALLIYEATCNGARAPLLRRITELADMLENQAQAIAELEDRWASLPTDQQEIYDLLEAQKQKIAELKADKEEILALWLADADPSETRWGAI